MNNVTLIGNLGRDPEYRETTTNVCKFTVAVTSGYGEKQRTDWIPVVCFGKTADNCYKYLKKGSRVWVVGRIQTDSYEKEGRNIYTTDIIASQIGFLTTRDNSSTREEKPARDENDAHHGYSALQYDDTPF